MVATSRLYVTVSYVSCMVAASDLCSTVSYGGAVQAPSAVGLHTKQLVPFLEGKQKLCVRAVGVPSRSKTGLYGRPRVAA